MTKLEFQSLKAGDRVSCNGTVVIVVPEYMEYEYDYSVSPAKKVLWKVQLSNGTNLQSNDDLSRIRLVNYKKG